MDLALKPTKRRLIRASLVLLISLAVCSVIAIILVMTTLDRHVQIDDPARYKELLSTFPANITPHIPASIPPDAAAVKLRFESHSGLGPSSTNLQVQFTVSPARAREIIADAKTRQPSWTPKWSDTDMRISVSRGDQIGVVEADLATGIVDIQVSNN